MKQESKLVILIVLALSTAFIAVGIFIGNSVGYASGYASGVAHTKIYVASTFVITPQLWYVLTTNGVPQNASFFEFAIREAQIPCTAWFLIANNMTLQQCKTNYA